MEENTGEIDDRELEDIMGGLELAAEQLMTLVRDVAEYRPETAERLENIEMAVEGFYVRYREIVGPFKDDNGKLTTVVLNTVWDELAMLDPAPLPMLVKTRWEIYDRRRNDFGGEEKDEKGVVRGCMHDVMEGLMRKIGLYQGASSVLERALHRLDEANTYRSKADEFGVKKYKELDRFLFTAICVLDHKRREYGPLFTEQKFKRHKTNNVKVAERNLVLELMRDRLFRCERTRVGVPPEYLFFQLDPRSRYMSACYDDNFLGNVDIASTETASAELVMRGQPVTSIMQYFQNQGLLHLDPFTMRDVAIEINGNVRCEPESFMYPIFIQRHRMWFASNTHTFVLATEHLLHESQNIKEFTMREEHGRYIQGRVVKNEADGDGIGEENPRYRTAIAEAFIEGVDWRKMVRDGVTGFLRPKQLWRQPFETYPDHDGEEEAVGGLFRKSTGASFKHCHTPEMLMPRMEREEKESPAAYFNRWWDYIEPFDPNEMDDREFPTWLTSDVCTTTASFYRMWIEYEDQVSANDLLPELRAFLEYSLLRHVKPVCAVVSNNVFTNAQIWYLLTLLSGTLLEGPMNRLLGLIDKFVVFHGDANTGKSLLVKYIEFLNGQQHCSTQHGSGATDQDLFKSAVHTRVTLFNDVVEKFTYSSQKYILNAASSETTVVRRMKMNPTTARISSQIFISTNAIGKALYALNHPGLFRRMIMFPLPVPTAHVDPEIESPATFEHSKPMMLVLASRCLAKVERLFRRQKFILVHNQPAFCRARSDPKIFYVEVVCGELFTFTDLAKDADNVRTIELDVLASQVKARLRTRIASTRSSDREILCLEDYNASVDEFKRYIADDREDMQTMLMFRKALLGVLRALGANLVYSQTTGAVTHVKALPKAVEEEEEEK